MPAQLGATDVTHGEDVLDRIDVIVPPGRTLNTFDEGHVGDAELTHTP